MLYYTSSDTRSGILWNDSLLEPVAINHWVEQEQKKKESAATGEKPPFQDEQELSLKVHGRSRNRGGRPSCLPIAPLEGWEMADEQDRQETRR